MRSLNATRALLVLFVCLICSTLLIAQSTGGRILGHVSDASGASVASAKVTLNNEATGVSRDVKTNDSGDYVLLEVQPGQYNIKVEQQGFTTSPAPGAHC